MKLNVDRIRDLRDNDDTIPPLCLDQARNIKAILDGVPLKRWAATVEKGWES